MNRKITAHTIPSGTIPAEKNEAILRAVFEFVEAANTRVHIMPIHATITTTDNNPITWAYVASLEAVIVDVVIDIIMICTYTYYGLYIPHIILSRYHQLILDKYF